MTLHTETPDGLRLLQGDVREVLRGLPERSVHVAVTSPPYFGLRSYAIGSDGHHEIGRESTVAEYVENTVAVCREIRRVLRDDGTLWWNVGDSFAGNGGPPGGQGQSGVFGGPDKLNNKKARAADPTYQQKQLLMVPFRVAIALQEDGWFVRQDIIWEKGSPMPESVTDRPTSSHEHIFLLAKSPCYYFDALAVREAGTVEQTEHNRRYARGYYRQIEASEGGVPGAQNNLGMHARPGVGGHNLRSVWRLSNEPQSDALCRACGAYYQGSGWGRLKIREQDGIPQRICRCGAIDWVAHFAAFPSEIPKRAILAGTSEEGVCAGCGAPLERVTARFDADEVNPRHFSKMGQEDRQDSARVYTETLVKTVGWTPACKCSAEIVPAVVLDPFVGSGTTLLAARTLGRRGVGIDLSKDYLDLARHRLEEVPLSLFSNYREPEQGVLL